MAARIILEDVHLPAISLNQSNIIAMSTRSTNLGPHLTGHLDEALDHTRHMLNESLSIRNISHATGYFVTSPNKVNTDLTVPRVPIPCWRADLLSPDSMLSHTYLS
jgi:hypothetical protein